MGSNWTARLFVIARRLIGLRLKIVVLLAAEVVGLCYYHLLAVQLPQSRLRSQLLEIVEDERSHLYFHCESNAGRSTHAAKRCVVVKIEGGTR